MRAPPPPLPPLSLSHATNASFSQSLRRSIKWSSKSATASSLPSATAAANRPLAPADADTPAPRGEATHAPPPPPPPLFVHAISGMPPLPAE